MSFQDNLATGKIGEAHIARWLRRRGWNVLPVYEKEIEENKGPVLYQAIGSPLVAPDMLTFKTEGATPIIQWVEAKTKSAFTEHHKTRVWNTGIDLRHYEEYQKVAALSSWPVWLLFLQQAGQAKDSPAGSPTGLFGGELAYLAQHEHHRWVKSRMVYWDHQTLRKIASLSAVLQGEEDNRNRQAPIRWTPMLPMNDKVKQATMAF